MESFCIFDAQCTGVWPRTTCVNGRCRCSTDIPNPQREVQTRDGWVCVETTATPACPLPNLFPESAALREKAPLTGFVQCSVASTDTTVGGPTGTCHPDNTAAPTDPAMIDTYDCVDDGTGTGVCCPNRGNITIKIIRRCVWSLGFHCRSNFSQF